MTLEEIGDAEVETAMKKMKRGRDNNEEDEESTSDRY